MRAIAIKQPWAEQIARGEKRTENRTRKLAPGPLVIASGGRAVCVVELVRVTGRPGAYAWHVARARRVEPVPVRSYGWVVHVDDALVRPLDGGPVPRGSPSARRSSTSSPRASRRTDSHVDPATGCVWCFVDAHGEPIREPLPEASPWD